MKFGSVKILRDLVVIEPLAQKKKSTGGFAMPDEFSGYSGKVVGLGPKTEDIGIGDIVYFGNESKSMTIKGQEVVVMEQNNVIGIEASTKEDEEETTAS